MYCHRRDGNNNSKDEIDSTQRFIVEFVDCVYAGVYEELGCFIGGPWLTMKLGRIAIICTRLDTEYRGMFKLKAGTSSIYTRVGAK